MKQEADVLTRLRVMILQGRLAPGERITEAQVADMLGLSRTPVRQALPVLAEEGLLVASGARGFAVRVFTIGEIAEGVTVRAALEGLAARTLADRGLAEETRAQLDAILADGDAIFAKRHLVEVDEQLYGAMNAAFHAAIVEAAGVSIVRELLARVNRIPFASPATIAFDRADLGQMYDQLWYAHRQHHDVVDALVRGEGARAEALLREHAHTQMRSMNLRRDEPTLDVEAEPSRRSARSRMRASGNLR